MNTMKNAILGMTSVVGMFFAILGLLLIILAISFLFFTFGYWLITLILAGFFGFILPFSWWYSLGAWLIALIAGAFILPTKTIKFED